MTETTQATEGGEAHLEPDYVKRVALAAESAAELAKLLGETMDRQTPVPTTCNILLLAFAATLGQSVRDEEGLRAVLGGLPDKLETLALSALHARLANATPAGTA